MADRGRGGYQPPRNPAPVSNPGSGRRTDGGAGNARQPLRVAPGGRYGERQALEAQQRGAPLPDNGGLAQTPTVSPPMGDGAPPVRPAGGVFGPTQRPMESPSQGMGPSQDAIASNPQAALRVLYGKFPHPAIARLIDWSSNGGLPE